MVESIHRGFVFPDNGMGYPNYYLLCSSSEPGLSSEFLHDKNAPYYHSEWNPCHFLVNIQPFPGGFMGKQLEPAGLSPVKIGIETLWNAARNFQSFMHDIDLDVDDSDWQDMKEDEEVKSDFYDLWNDGKIEDAIARVKQSWIEFNTITFSTKTGDFISVGCAGVVVIDNRCSNETLQFLDELINTIVENSL